MSKREPDVLIEDIITCIKNIQEYTLGMTKVEFFKDGKTKDAVVRNMEIIGEAAKRLPEDMRSKYSNVEWVKIIGMRNRIAHDYFNIDPDIVWTVISVEIEPLKEILESILHSFDN